MIRLNIHLANSIKIEKVDYPAMEGQKPFVVYTVIISHPDGNSTEVRIFGAPGLEVTL
jgi:hypothetical protein